jgi:AcrR family transcriptional regulator
MRPGKPPTPKGERTSQAILEAAVRCVARDGVAASSIQRIADEAGVGKRAVIYYFRSREGLLDAVVRHVGDQMLDRLDVALRGLDDPAQIVERGFDIVWEAVTTDRALLAAWFGLHAEAVTNPESGPSAAYINDRIGEIATGLMHAQMARGRRLRVEPDALRVLIVANVQGLAGFYLQHGDSPALQAAIREFQVFLSTVVAPAGRRARSAA